jgi:hypothetical protein
MIRGLSDRLSPFSLLFLSYSALRNASQGRLWYVRRRLGVEEPLDRDSMP